MFSRMAVRTGSPDVPGWMVNEFKIRCRFRGRDYEEGKFSSTNGGAVVELLLHILFREIEEKHEDDEVSEDEDDEDVRYDYLMDQVCRRGSQHREGSQPGRGRSPAGVSPMYYCTARGRSPAGLQNAEWEKEANVLLDAVAFVGETDFIVRTNEVIEKFQLRGALVDRLRGLPGGAWILEAVEFSPPQEIVDAMGAYSGSLYEGIAGDSMKLYYLFGKRAEGYMDSGPSFDEKDEEKLGLSGLPVEEKRKVSLQVMHHLLEKMDDKMFARTYKGTTEAIGRHRLTYFNYRDLMQKHEPNLVKWIGHIFALFLSFEDRRSLLSPCGVN